MESAIEIELLGEELTVLIESLEFKDLALIGDLAILKSQDLLVPKFRFRINFDFVTKEEFS